PEVRLLTITGTGGTGKTRLALHLGTYVHEMYRDGVHVVSLAALSDPGLVACAIATTLGIQEVGGQPLLDTIINQLATRHLLLVLDNFEHVLDAALLVGRLLQACPTVHVLVTSR